MDQRSRRLLLLLLLVVFFLVFLVDVLRLGGGQRFDIAACGARLLVGPTRGGRCGPALRTATAPTVLGAAATTIQQPAHSTAHGRGWHDVRCRRSLAAISIRSGCGGRKRRRQQQQQQQRPGRRLWRGRHPSLQRRRKHPAGAAAACLRRDFAALVSRAGASPAASARASGACARGAASRLARGGATCGERGCAVRPAGPGRCRRAAAPPPAKAAQQEQQQEGKGQRRQQPQGR